MIVLHKNQIIRCHDILINKTGGRDGIRDSALLDMATKSAFQTFNNEYVYHGIIKKAAMLAFSLVKGHPFIDGNKRTALHCMLLFLRLNEVHMKPIVKKKDYARLFFDLANSKIGLDPLVEWLDNHVVKY